MTIAEQMEETPGRLGESRIFRDGRGCRRGYQRAWWEACPQCGRRRWVRKAQRGALCCSCNAERTCARNQARKEAA